MISLLFKFLGDSTPLKREAEKAKGEMSKAGGDIGKEFGTQLKGQMMAAIGVGAVVSALRKSMEEATKAANEAALGGGVTKIRENIALSRAAEATGLQKSEIMDIAKQRPDVFGQFIKQFEPIAPEGQMREVSVASEKWSLLSTAIRDRLSEFSAMIARAIIGALGVEGARLSGNPAMMQNAMRELSFSGSRNGPPMTTTERFMSAVGENREMTRKLEQLLEAVEKGSDKIKSAVDRN